MADELANGHYLYTRFNNSVEFMNSRGGTAATASNRIGQAHVSDRGTDGYVEIIIGNSEHDVSRGSLHFYLYRKDLQTYSYDTTLQNVGPTFPGGSQGYGSVLHGTQDNNMLFISGDIGDSKKVLAFTRRPTKSWRETFSYLYSIHTSDFHTRHETISRRDATSSTSYDRDNYHSVNAISGISNKVIAAFKWISSSEDGEFIVLNNPYLLQLYVFKKPPGLYTIGGSGTPEDPYVYTNNINELVTGYSVNDYTLVQVINAEDFDSTSPASVVSPPQYYYGPCNSGASIEGAITRSQHTIDYNYFSTQDSLLFGGAQEYNKVISPNGKVLALIDSGYKNSNATVYGDTNDYLVGIIIILERSSTEDHFTYSQHFIGEFYAGVSSTSAVTTGFGEFISVGNDSIIASSGNSSLTHEQNKMYYINKNASGTWVVDNIPGPNYASETNGVIGKQLFGSYDNNSIVTSNGRHDNGNKNPIYFYKDYNKSKLTSYNGDFTNVTANLLNTAYAPVVTSDDRYKINEEVINNGLESIRQLVPKRYLKTNKEYEANYMGNLHFGDKGTVESGLIAQEVNDIPSLSYLVKYENNRYSLCYNDLFVHNISATKELDTIVQAQQQEIQELRRQIEKLTPTL